MNEFTERATKMAEATGKSWSGASVEAIEQFLSDLAEAQTHSPRVQLDTVRFWGKTKAEMIAYAQQLNANDKRRAGVKGLIKKYGHDGASAIVRKHSGRNIR